MHRDKIAFVLLMGLSPEQFLVWRHFLLRGFRFGRNHLDLSFFLLFFLLIRRISRIHETRNQKYRGK